MPLNSAPNSCAVILAPPLATLFKKWHRVRAFFQPLGTHREAVPVPVQDLHPVPTPVARFMPELQGRDWSHNGVTSRVAGSGVMATAFTAALRLRVALAFLAASLRFVASTFAFLVAAAFPAA